MSKQPTDSTTVLSLRRKLLNWFDKHKRELPWRVERTPYKVWISEIMLQQTQVKTVIPYFKRFMETFPSIEALALANEEAVLKAWEGLGYYRRARNLHASAQMIVEHYDGDFPENFSDILSLKGIGPYTAGAVASIAFAQKKPVVDGNVKRVLSRLHGFKEDISKQIHEKKIWDWAHGLLPNKNPGDLNEALMELGALICTPGANPSCNICPWEKDCLAKQRGAQAEIPHGIKRPKIITKQATAWLISFENTYLVRKRPLDVIMGGLWEFPTHDGAKIKGLPHNKSVNELAFTHYYTRYKIELKVKRLLVSIKKEKVSTAWPEGNRSTWAWVTYKELKKLPFSAPQVKILEHLEQEID